MNKCPNCSTEFEGRFCPKCGAQWSDEKTCPECGAKLSGSARFCNECGHAFTNEPRYGQAVKKQVNVLQVFFSALYFVPFACIALFSVLLFAFYSAPVANMILGMGLPNESLGNVYSMHSGILSEIPEVGGAMIALIVYAVICPAFAVAFGLILFLPKCKYKEVNLFKKWSLPLTALFGYTSFVLYLLAFIFGIAIIGTVSSVDDGMGFFKSGACPVLLIVFSLIFALFAAGAFVGRYLLARKKPEASVEEEKQRTAYFTAEAARKERFFATHSAPVAPKVGKDGKPNKTEAIVYRHAKRRYDRACETATPTAILWIDIHKIPLIIGTAVLILAIVLMCIFIPVMTSKFKVSAVEKIELNYTQEQVKKALGSPYTEASTDNRWQYYSKPYTKVLDKLAQNEKEQEKALERGDENKLLKLAAEELKLEEELNTVKYKYIEICFEQSSGQGYVVSSVYFEKNRCDNNPPSGRELKSVSLSADYYGYYVDKTGEEEQTFLISFKEETALYYSARFTDGSFYRTYLKNGSTEIGNNTVVTTWTDRFASYKTTVNGSIPKVGEVDKDGCWKTIASDVVSLTLPDSVKAITQNSFNSGLKSIYLPGSITSIAGGCFCMCPSIETISIVGDNPVYYSADNCIIERETNTLIAGCNGSSIPEGVTAIGENAFSGCSKLTSITIPSSVTSIGVGAFQNCSNLTEIVVPENLSYIGENAFGGCDSLPRTTYGNAEYLGSKDNPYLYLIRGQANCTIHERTKIIGEEAFSNCTGLTSIEIPSGVIHIGSSAFSGCTGLTTIEIPSSVSYMGTNVFKGCANLQPQITEGGVKYLGGSDNPYLYLWGVTDKTITNLTISERTKFISSGAFSGCNKLTEITIPASVTYIESGAFSSCDSLERIGVDPDNISYSSRDGILYNYEKTKFVHIPKAIKGAVAIPDGISSIDESAFSGCSGLTEITLPTSVTSIGSKAFYNCTGLTRIEIPSSIVSISGNAFYGCTNLQPSATENVVKYLGNAGNLYLYLWGVTDKTITNLTINEGTKLIAASAFAGCSNLLGATIPINVTTIGEYAFRDCTNLRTVNWFATNCTKAGSYESSSKDYTIFKGCTSLTTVNIAGNVKIIPAYAFYGCNNLMEITIPASVTSIGWDAFCDCYRLIEVCNNSSLPIEAGESSSAYGCVAYYAKNVYSMKEGSSKLNDHNGYIFYEDSEKGEYYLVRYTGDQTELSLPEIGHNYEINRFAFRGCSSLTSVTIPASVTSIGYSAFYNCSNLTSVTIPASVTSIGFSAFLGCDSLTEVYYGSSIADWLNIDFGNYQANPLCSGADLYIDGEKQTAKP